VLATQIRQKDGFSTSAASRSRVARQGPLHQPLLRRRRANRPARISQDDEIAQFIAKIERTDRAFQRTLSRAKVRQLKNFYETAITQPPIPGTVLLFTPESFVSSP